MPDVKDGECIVSIAEEFGIRDYKNLWDANQELQKTRPNPNMLVSGVDQFQEPPRQKTETGSHGERHTFVVPGKKLPSLRIVLLNSDGNPMRGAQWAMTTPVQKNGTTGQNGLVEIKDFPPSATSADLTVTPMKAQQLQVEEVNIPVKGAYPAPIVPDQFTDKLPQALPDSSSVQWKLKVGSLPSFNHNRGLTARLNNLGAMGIVSLDNLPGRCVKSYARAFVPPPITGERVQQDLRDRHDKKP